MHLLYKVLQITRNCYSKNKICYIMKSANIKVALIIFLCNWFHIETAIACRYNVREAGFVDLRISTYRLYCYVSNDTPTEIQIEFSHVTSDFLIYSNIEAEIINIEQQKNHPAMKYIPLWQINSFPAAVLVSPDGQSLFINLIKPNLHFKEILQTALDEILFSPKRKEILQIVTRNYAVLLLIEGSQEKENERALEAVSAAIERTAKTMGMMPKPIKYAPALVVIDAKSIHREKILLWSLGLEGEKFNKPHALVIYGRARWIGPLFRGDEIEKEYLTEILAVVGADCECGLDREWVLGTMLPVKWDKQIQAEVAKSLGFDPENPMIKMEVNRIIHMGSFYSGVAATDRKGFSSSDSAVQKTIGPEEESDLHKSLYLTLFLMLMIVLGGAIIVLRRAKKRI